MKTAEFAFPLSLWDKWFWQGVPPSDYDKILWFSLPAVCPFVSGLLLHGVLAVTGDHLSLIQSWTDCPVICSQQTASKCPERCFQSTDCSRRSPTVIPKIFSVHRLIPVLVASPEPLNELWGRAGADTLCTYHEAHRAITENALCMIACPILPICCPCFRFK